MKDPEIELKRRLHKVKTGQDLTYEEFCLFEIRNLVKADKISAKDLKTTRIYIDTLLCNAFERTKEKQWPKFFL